MAELPKIPNFERLRWEAQDGDQWHLRDGDNLVGEVYERDLGWYWSCKTSDQRQGGIRTAEQAKFDCLVNYVKDAMYTYAMDRCAAVTAA